MDWSPLTADVAPPVELRARLAERGGTWSNRLAVLDAALEVLVRHGVVPELAIAWPASPGTWRTAVFASDGVCVAGEGPTGVVTRWYPAETVPGAGTDTDHPDDTRHTDDPRHTDDTGHTGDTGGTGTPVPLGPTAEVP